MRDPATPARRLSRSSRRLFTLCLALGLVAVARGAAPDNPLSIATGRIHYRIAGRFMNGTLVWSWIDHGRKFRQEAALMGGPSGLRARMESSYLSDGESLYVKLPVGDKQWARMKSPRSLIGRWRTAKDFLGRMGLPSDSATAGTVVGSGRILGKMCAIRAIGRQRLWLWNGLPLKAALHPIVGPATMLVATKLETSPKLSPALFKVPAGYRVKEMPAPNQ